MVVMETGPIICECWVYWSRRQTRTKECHQGELSIQLLPKIGKLIPSPVTDHLTEYSTIDILKHLSQTILAVACDKGKHHIEREITLGNATQFNSVLCLGTFYIVKYSLAALVNIYKKKKKKK